MPSNSSHALFRKRGSSSADDNASGTLCHKKAKYAGEVITGSKDKVMSERCTRPKGHGGAHITPSGTWRESRPGHENYDD